MNNISEFQRTSEQPVIDVIGITTNTENIGFEIENIRYCLFNFFLKISLQKSQYTR